MTNWFDARNPPYTLPAAACVRNQAQRRTLQHVPGQAPKLGLRKTKVLDVAVVCDAS